MNWYYDAGGGQRQGPISELELDRLLAQGRITPQTLVWREGMADWAPLHEARPTPPSMPAGSTETERCDSCGNFVPTSELAQIGERNICASCKPAFLQQVQSGAPLPSAEAFDRSGPAWEQREQLGLPKAAWLTIKSMLTDPAVAFAQMKRTGGLGTPLLYNVLIGTIGSVAGLVYQLLVNSSMGQMQGQLAGALPPEMARFATGSYVTIGMALFMPIFIAMGSFIYAGIMHLSLMICGGARQPFETTFRVYCYASGSAAALQVVPGCGALVYGVWALVCMCIGIAKAHEITTPRAVVAVLLPTVVCCVGFMAIIGAVIGAAAAMAGSH